MYIRTTTRRNRDGSTVRYLQLAQAERDPQTGLPRARQYELPVERALFALVANRALAPSSTLATERWVAEAVVIPALPQVPVHHLYRAMDFLLAAEAEEEVQHHQHLLRGGGGRRGGRPARVAQAGVGPRPSP